MVDFEFNNLIGLPQVREAEAYDEYARRWWRWGKDAS
jgi:hypothetical protein